MRLQCFKMARSMSAGTSLLEFLRHSGVLLSLVYDPVSQDLSFTICKMGAGVGPCSSIVRNETAPGTQYRLLFRSFFSLSFPVLPGPCQSGAKKMVLRGTKQHFPTSPAMHFAGISICLNSFSTVSTAAHQKLCHH